MERSPYIRPQTPQALLHRAPSKTSPNSTTKPERYIILLLAPLSFAGKVQIATSISQSLSCPLYQGDSLHESSAKAASVGASRSDDRGKGRYQRMWMSKMTRTGLLFPEESRAAHSNEVFVGFGGGETGSTGTSRRGSLSSVESLGSFGGESTASSSASGFDGGDFGMGGSRRYINQPVFTILEEERRKKENPALMVLTHPELEAWHKDAIRQSTGEYGIGIIFVPLFKRDTAVDGGLEEEGEDEMPVLRPLDPRMVSAFTSFDALRGAIGNGQDLKYGKGKEGNLDEEMVLEVDVGGNVEEIIDEVLRGVKDVMFA